MRCAKIIELLFIFKITFVQIIEEAANFPANETLLNNELEEEDWQLKINKWFECSVEVNRIEFIIPSRSSDLQRAHCLQLLHFNTRLFHIQLQVSAHFQVIVWPL